MKLKDIADYVTEKISSDAIDLASYVTTDSLLQNKTGREKANNLPPQSCTLTKFRKGDILIGNIRPYLKKIWMADIDGGCNADVLVIRAKEGHSSDFVYAVMLQDAFYDYAMKGAKGSKMPRGDKDQIIRYEIPTLAFSEASIGKFIVDINSKIALNREINRNLEAMARQLYDYWFVQFDFPDENGGPYKSSGGKMVWNEKLKREIPEGWTGIRVSDIEPIIITGKTPSTSHEEFFGGVIPFVTIDDIRNSRFVRLSARTLTIEGANSQKKKYLPQGSLMCSCIGTVGVMGFAGRALQTNQQINSIIFSNRTNAEFLFFALEKYFNSADAKVGNILPNMSKQEFSDIIVAYPHSSILEKFAQITNVYFKKIDSTCSEIETLITQRDELLPLLMNGQVSVMPSEINCDLSHD